MQYKIPIFALLATLLTPALALQDFGVTKEELAMMPPYCTALYGAAVGLPKMQESPLRGTIPPNCPTLQHYCDALKSVIRADKNQPDSGYWLHQAVVEFNLRASGWEQMAPACSLRAEAHTNLGKALLRQNKGSRGPAITNFYKALELRPDFIPAYYALSDAYVANGNKQNALGTIEQGLKYAPLSKGLLRRFKELGGRNAPAPIAESADQAAQVNRKQEQTLTPSKESEEADSYEPAPASAIVADPGSLDGHDMPSAPAETDSLKIGTPSNPYCRFCPD